MLHWMLHSIRALQWMLHSCGPQLIILVTAKILVSTHTHTYLGDCGLQAKGATFVGRLKGNAKEHNPLDLHGNSTAPRKEVIVG